MRSAACLIMLVAGSAAAWALQADLTRDGAGRVTQATVETADYKLTMDAAKGARIMSLVDKRADVELAQHDASGLGGLFEDRPLFSTDLYLCHADVNTPEQLVLRCVASKDGVSLTKTYTFTEGQPFFGVRYEIENGTQLPFKLWIRNFANPGGGPITEADHLFLRDTGKLIEVPFPHEYYKSLDAPWAAYLDTAQQSGYFVRCDFDLLDQFYYWSESRIIPTFEWVYKPVPAGQKTSTNLIFGLIGGVKSVGDVLADGRVTEETGVPPEARVEPQFAALPDWKPLEELYQPTPEEQARGFIAVVSGVPSPAPRLRDIAVDVGLQEAEAVPVELFALAERVEVKGAVAGLPFEPQTEGEGWLNDGDTLAMERGRSGRLWLKLANETRQPGAARGTLTLASGQGQALAIPLQLTTWNATLPEQPVIGTQYYCLLPTLSAYELDEAARRKFLVYMDNLQALHCDNCDWGVAAHYPAVHATVQGTGETLQEWGKARAGVTPDKLPDVDFGYYDTWFEECVKRGMTRFVAHVPSSHGWGEASVVSMALGKPVEDANTDEGWQVMVWYYRQLRQYAERKGFTSFWAKLDDEIPQEHIAAWLVAAERYRSAGYKPFTTNTGAITRSPTLLAEMNKQSEAWQVALCLSRDLMDLTRQGAAFETKRDRLDMKWGPYGNGGAVDTWAALIFGEEMPTEKMDEVEVLVNGQPLRMLGGSPWGNQQHSVSFQLGPWMYVSLPDGGDPNAATMEVSYRLRTLQEDGEPAVKLEPTDEQWYYGGGNYRSSYEASRAYPWRVCAYDMRGYGYWTYLWWNDSDILVKYRPETNDLLISGAWEGLRDGNEDAAYFRLAEEELKQAGREDELARLRGVFGRDEQAALRMGEVKSEIYAWDDFINPTQAGYNAAKREALRVLAR